MKAGQTFGVLPAAGEHLLSTTADRSVFIAVPIFFHIDPHFFVSAMKLTQDMQRLGIHGAFKPNIGDSAVGRSRNVLTRQFLESDCTHMLMIDSDLVFSAEHIQNLLACDEPIVAGVYCKKQEGEPGLVVNGIPGEQEPRSDFLWEVAYAGTGFMRIAREVFERMIDKIGPEIVYTCDHDASITEYDFWAMGPYQYPDGRRRWLSEDWMFCQRARDLGYKVYIDRHTVLKHSGNALYPLSYQADKLLVNMPLTGSDSARQTTVLV